MPFADNPVLGYTIPNPKMDFKTPMSHNTDIMVNGKLVIQAPSGIDCGVPRIQGGGGGREIPLTLKN